MPTKTKTKKPARKKVERVRQPGAPYRIGQAAAALNIAPRTLRKRIAAGELRAYKDGRLVLITEEALAEYQAERRGAEPLPRAGSGLAIRRHLRL